MNTDTAVKPFAITAEEAKSLLNKPVMTTIRWATFEFAWRFISPVKIDRMTDEQLLGIRPGQTPVVYPNDEPLETTCIRKMYSDEYDENRVMPVGNIGIPQENIYAALCDAGESVKYGTGQSDKVTLASKGTELFYFVQLCESFYPFVNLETGEPFHTSKLLDDRGYPVSWEVDIARGMPSQKKSGGGAICIIRPRFDEVGIVGHMKINIDKLSPAKAFELVCVGGLKHGLASARPACKMPFGQYAPTHWKWVGGADPERGKASISTASRPSRRRKKQIVSNGGDGE